MSSLTSLQPLALSLLSPCIKRGAATLARRFLRRDALVTQQQLFLELVRKAATTRFGQAYGFAELARIPFDRAYHRFQQNVPIRGYDDFWNDYFGPCFTTSVTGNRLDLHDITWPGTITLFCETSGTTAPTKYIPFSREMFLANRLAARDLIACYLAHNQRSRLLQGRFLYMSGSTELSCLGDSVLSGDMSAITLRFAPPYLKPFIVPDLSIAGLPWEQKLEALAGLLLKDRWITGISGVPPWILLLLKRCQEIGNAPLADLLPRLELIIHGGTSLKPYRREFDGIFAGRPPVFLEVLPSSEAFMGFQVAGDVSLRLTPYYGAFFEFIPFDQLGETGKAAAGSRAVPLEDIREGERYAIIISTCAGLWRYHIGDTVRIHSRSTLTVEFTGRDRFLDSFEEKVTQSEVELAIAMLSRDRQFPVCEFIVGPDIDSRRHLWVIAVKGAPAATTGELALFLDACLKEQNADYDTSRRQSRINPPLVIIVAEDLIYRWSRDIRGKLGGQSKIPHIDPTPAGELLQSLVLFSGQTIP